MNLRVEGPYIHCILPLFGGIPITQTAISSLLVTVFLCWACIALGRDLEKRPGRRQVLVEKAVILARRMVAETMGEHNVHWTPFVASIFLCSICGSWIGLTGFFRSTTADLSCTLVWALMVTVTIWYHSIKHNGFGGWLRGFTRPIAVMTPMNVISEIAQPVSMAFRHFGNVAGGSVITALIYTALSLASEFLLGRLAAGGMFPSLMLILLGLVLGKKRGPWGLIPGLLGLCGILEATALLPGIPILSWGIPAVLSCYFDLFSGFVQAYVFSLLTMVYIAAALPPEPLPNHQLQEE